VDLEMTRVGKSADATCFTFMALTIKL